MAPAANVKKLCLYHHDPMNDDTKMVQIAAPAQKQFAGAVIAIAGIEVSL